MLANKDVCIILILLYADILLCQIFYEKLYHIDEK